MLGLVLVVALAAALAWEAIRRQQPLPLVERMLDQNVLLITIDTLRADTLAMYGGPAAAPNLERLAHEGIRYSFAHAHAVSTLPSHATILSGLYPFAHGVRDNHSGFRLPSAITTVAERLKKQSFATAAFVSAFPLDSVFGLNAGFDHYDDETPDSQAPTDFLAPERPGLVTVQRARVWIAKQTSRWFLWVHLFEPHAPYQAPPDLQKVYGRDLTGAYAAEVAFVDRLVGPLLDDVRAAKRPTFVVVTSDHGEGLGDHGELTHGVFAYESTLHVPLVVAQIGGPREPSRPGESPVTSDIPANSSPARHVDVVPTILDALGIVNDVVLPGRSLLRPPHRNVISYFESMAMMLTRGWAPLSGVIHDRLKLVDLPLPELYDLAADPNEQSNLYAGRPRAREQLHALLRGFGARLPDAVGLEDPDVAARLRSLGYIGGSAPRKARYTEEDDPKRLVQLDRDMHQAGWLRETGAPQQSIALYRSIIDRRPTMEPAWRFLAFVQWESGDRPGAIATLEEAVRRGVATADTVRQLEEYLSARSHLYSER